MHFVAIHGRAAGVVGFRCPESYAFPCQLPVSTGMVGTFVVS
jgi:hypothetical protein